LAGVYTRAATPARVAYAASATPALPAVGTTSRRTPACAARVTAAASPRALKEPVGLPLSSLTQRSPNPCRAATRSPASSGLPPPPDVTGDSPSARGGH